MDLARRGCLVGVGRERTGKFQIQNMQRHFHLSSGRLLYIILRCRHAEPIMMRHAVARATRES